ncbi:Uncharacterized protein PBTT_07692 [Plasmodiophora brassicae]|uniref:Uncharacterized protein n=1 Tax=Plasmodiophora brassicae TaxID=37360 RepID=A0A0G4IJQ8_PLABS|nr:hypothetical protein PBRA_009671 [Plasmodiophora brassicae]SPQ99130.1 unnamed protein product [Plasmodiophora brassicae]
MLMQECKAPELPNLQNDDKTMLTAFGKFVEFLYKCDMGHGYVHRTSYVSGVTQDQFHGMKRLEPAPLGHPVLRKHWMYAMSDAFSLYDKEDFANVMAFLVGQHGGDESAAMDEFLRRKHKPTDDFVFKRIKLLKPPPMDLFRRLLSVVLCFGFMRTGSQSQPLFSADRQFLC